MRKYNTNDINFEHPAITVDVLIFTVKDDRLKILLVRRGLEPYKGDWAIPGVFVNMDESLENAASRALKEKTGVEIEKVYLEQLYTFGELNRDPRSRVVTVAYFALSDNYRFTPISSASVQELDLFSIKKLPRLAFDHKKIIDTAIHRLRSKIEYSNIVQGLLPEKFRLSDLQKYYEIILGTKLDKRNFRKRMLGLKLLESVGEKDLQGAHRPAMLYRFISKKTVLFD